MPELSKIYWNAFENCNMKCGFCYLWRRRRFQSLSHTDAMRLVADAASAGFNWFVFGGGDPLLRSDLLPLIRSAKMAGLNVDLQTNGLLLDYSLIQYFKPYVSRFGLPLDGDSEILHDKIRSYPGHFKKVMGLLEICSHLAIPVVVRTIICKQNISHINSLGSVLANYPCIMKWSLREFIPLGRGAANKKDFSVSKAEFNSEVRAIRAAPTVARKNFHLKIISSDDMKHCYCLVSHDGAVYAHPYTGTYREVGKFPSESLKQLKEKLMIQES